MKGTTMTDPLVQVLAAAGYPTDPDRRDTTLRAARAEADERYTQADDKDAFIAGALWKDGYPW